MPPAITAGFKLFLKSNPNMRLLSDVAVNRITCEGVTSFESLADFDKDSLKELARNCREPVPAIAEDLVAGIAPEPEVPGSMIPTQSLVRLQVAAAAVKYYKAVGRTPTADNLHFVNVLQHFKIENDAYEQLKDQDAPEVPDIKDTDKEKRVIKWAPVFLDVMSRNFGVKGPLAYVLRTNVAVPDQVADPLPQHSHFGASGSLLQELIDRLPHGDALYRSDNKTVYMHIEKACRGTSVASTVKTFSRQQDGRSAYLALIDHHAGDSKYRTILKSKMNLLQNIKWNGRNYSLEKHVSNHRQAVEDIQDCSQHIQAAVPDASQRVEYLIDSIICNDSTLQASIGLIRSNVNNMRDDFESAANALIEVDPYTRARRVKPNSTAQVSSVDFNSGRGDTGVDLRWHTPKEFKDLTQEQKDELVQWQRTDDGKAVLAKSRETAKNKRKRGDDSGRGKGGTGKGGKDSAQGNHKKWLKKYVKKPDGMKHVMSLMSTVEKQNQTMLGCMQASEPTLPPAPEKKTASKPTVSFMEARDNESSAIANAYPATITALNNIMKNKN